MPSLSAVLREERDETARRYRELKKENKELKKLIAIADDLIFCNTDSYRINKWKEIRK